MNDAIDTSATLVGDVRGKEPTKRKIILRCMAVIYMPYAWLLFVESLWPWNAPQWTWTQIGITPWTWTGNHWLWLKLWPVLPGLVPTMVINAFVGIGRLPDWLEFLIGGLVSLAMIAGVVWAALRGGRWTIAALIACFVVSCAFSVMAYQLYAW